MPNPCFAQLSDTSRPLLDKFYRAQGSSMRAAAGARLWVARAPQIIAGLSLSSVAEGNWLTGLFVDPAWRNQAIARRLIEQASAQCQGPIWLFCHPDLLGFYQKLGFSQATALPQALADRLARYSRSKPLMALVCQSPAGSRSGNSTSVKPNLLKSLMRDG